VAVAALAAAALAAACATRPPGGGPRYPPRRPKCDLQIFHTPTPGVPAWDDLGSAEIICHIDEGEATCRRRLLAEACRMGGDILYDLPAKVLRPRIEAMVFRGRVAHTATPGRAEGEAADGHTGASNANLNGDDGAAPISPPPATPEESAGPVVPLTGPAAPPPTGNDGGEPHPPSERVF
jgi:hypothetical protein